MSSLCNVQIHINGQETFFLNEKILCTYSEKLRKIVKQEKKRAQNNKKKMITSIEIDGFPGGPLGFETVSRFCHNDNNGDQTTIIIAPSNVVLLYSCAIFLGMSENNNNLLQKTQTFLEGMFYWPWKDLLSCLKSCEPYLSHADSNGLLDKLFFALSAKMDSDSARVAATSPSFSSSPETEKATPESVKLSSCNKAWWFDDLTILPPKIVERLVNHLGLYTDNNINGLTVTKFLLHYLKQANTRRRANNNSRNYSSKVSVSLKTPDIYTRAEFVALADVAVRGVISAKKESFSCRSLFWALRVVVSGFGVRRELRLGLERLIGEALDQSKLDDLLVSSGQTNNGQRCGGVYDVNLVIRLVRVFVCTGGVSVQKLRRVGRLVDEYLCEISPDQSLKTTTFLEVAESVPDLARDCFDGVYRAIDIYLQSHPTLSSEERSTLCRCLNYKKLTLEACKELAKNPKIPPRIAMQALISQQSTVPTKQFYFGDDRDQHIGPKMAVHGGFDHSDQSYVDQSEDAKMNLKRMQRRVVELEKVCREMKGQMSRIMVINRKHNALPRLC